MPTVRFQLRRDTAANWTSVNPVLGSGEPALETDTLRVKYGNGVSSWNDLAYSGDALEYEEGEWTPVVSASSGALANYTAHGFYTRVGRQVLASINLTITDNGSGGSSLQISLPFANGDEFWIGSGRENAMTGIMLQSVIAPSGSTVRILTYNNAYPGGSGYNLLLSLSYST